jgi:hypothetical protein
MYILGFILIFAGLALMLYYFVLRFAATVSTTSVVPDASPAGPVVPAASTVTVTAQPVPEPAFFSEKAAPIASQPRIEPSSRRASESMNRKAVSVIDPAPEKELYATGYLYTDTAGKTALLEHPERVEGELTASMKRLGPATLRFRRDSYYFDHGDGLLVIPEGKMREVRFSDGGTVFVPGSSDLPLVYFFTVDTQAIREFLSSRS